MATTVDLGRVIGPTGPKGDTGPKGQDLVHKTYVIDKNTSQLYIPMGWYAVTSKINLNEPFSVKFKILKTGAVITPTSLVKDWTDKTYIGFLPLPDSDARTYDFIHIANEEITSETRVVAYIERQYAALDNINVVFTKID